MDNLIDQRFERVEKALATLITSISTYNPSIPHANDLVAADAELSQGLEQLSIHQANFAKILTLRAESDRLDSQIRDTLTLLATTRSELLAAPSTNFTSKANLVDVEEILSYASRSSKFTRPAAFREAGPTSNSDSGDGGINTPKEPGSQTQTNGTSTPVTGINGVDKDTQMTQAMAIDGATATQATNQNPQTAIPEQWLPMLNPEENMPFLPWPSEDTIRRGALASIELLINKGIDPATFDPEKSAELEAERKKLQDEEDMAREAERTRREEEQRALMERRVSEAGNATAARPEAPKQAAFSLDMLDDEEDDD